MSFTDKDPGFQEHQNEPEGRFARLQNKARIAGALCLAGAVIAATPYAIRGAADVVADRLSVDPAASAAYAEAQEYCAPITARGFACDPAAEARRFQAEDEVCQDLAAQGLDCQEVVPQVAHAVIAWTLGQTVGTTPR